MACEHRNTKQEEVSKFFLGEKFNYLAQVCRECGAVLWDKAVSDQFSQWLSSKGIPLERLNLQFDLNHTAYELLAQMIARFPGVDRSTMVRALVSVFMDVVLKDPLINDAVERVTAGDVFKSFLPTARDKKKVSVRFKPLALLDISDWARLTGHTNTKFVEEALLRMLSLHIEQDDEMKRIWEEKLKPSVETILKAA